MNRTGIPAAPAAPGIVVATLVFFAAFGALRVLAGARTGAAPERSFIAEALRTTNSSGA